MKQNDPFQKVLAAISFAARHHHGHLRKDNKTPYISHPYRVTFILRDLFGVTDYDILAACILHDTLEDTLVDFDDLEEEFGAEVAEWVGMLSKDSRLPFEKREQAYCQVLEEAPWQVQVCKLADVYDNLLDSGGFKPKRRANAVRGKARYIEAIGKRNKPEVTKAFELTSALYTHLAAEVGLDTE